MGLGQLGGQEEAGGLDDDVDIQSTPGDGGGILLGEDLDLVAVNDHVVALDLDVVVEDAVNRVVLQHIGQVFGIQQVVDADNRDVLGEVLDGGAENHAADAAKAIDTNFNHCL